MASTATASRFQKSVFKEGESQRWPCTLFSILSSLSPYSSYSGGDKEQQRRETAFWKRRARVGSGCRPVCRAQLGAWQAGRAA